MTLNNPAEDNEMIVNGFHTLFLLYIENCEIDTYRELGFYEDAADMKHDFQTAKANLASGETLTISAGVIEDGEFIECFFLPADHTDLSSTEINNLNEDLKNEIPDQTISRIPKRKRIMPGKKDDNLNKYVYLCDQCGCPIDICNNGTSSRFLRKDVDSRKILCGSNPCMYGGGNKYTTMCPNCFLPLSKCECQEYPRHVFSVDSEIADTISLLNRKGYFTDGSCVGHKPGDIAYISFVVRYDIPIPDGMFWSINYHVSYRLSEDEKSFFSDREKMITSFNNWATQLPPLEDAFGEYADPVIYNNLKALLQVPMLNALFSSIKETEENNEG